MELAITQIVRDKKAFVVATGFTNIPVDNAEHDFLLIKNPSGNELDILVTHASVGTNSTSVRSNFFFYADPTITSDGTSLSISNTYIGSGAPATQSQAFVNPTISSKGNKVNTVIMPANSASRGTNRYFWIAPGSSLLVTVDNSIVNAKSFCELYFLEGI